jgi:hypothetical protein
MPCYALFLHADAANFFHSLRREEKEPLRRFLDLLEQYPTTVGEATERDSVGRTVQVGFVRRLRVVYGRTMRTRKSRCCASNGCVEARSLRLVRVERPTL